MAEPKKLPSGKWQIRFRYKDPITNVWKNKMITDTTKKAVNAQYADFLVRLNKGSLQTKVSLLDFFDEYVETFKKGKVSKITLNKYETTRKSLKRFFGEKQTVAGITKLSYQKFLNWLANEGGHRGGPLSKVTVQNRHDIVKSVFLEALDMGLISTNPCRRAKISGDEAFHDKEKTMSRENTKKFRSVLLSRPDSTGKYFVLTQLYTGCRYQEIAALLWDDLNEENGTIAIRRAYQYQEEERGLGKTKTPYSIRDVDVPSSLFRELRKYKAIQNERMLLGKLKNPRGLVFVNDRNTWPITNDYVNKYIEETCQLADVPRITSHAFRHAKIDAMILAEADPIYIKSQVGHKNIAQSYDYATATQENRQKNKEKVLDFMKGIEAK
ncbi:tyrosine-type recombinase/integrase [Enterococcus dispar]|uniref:Tyr recombinase domain-containing protein n=1 Tax=Enterococcus dispar ATCC 51266 TaxID=1139219 RepID=S0KD51_9ENTE|nr:site-specific integrase [Enterococcus dispar]EOT42632.1 hypothetical protein OMK_00993 [Enterococcus dispar ATCC 51266]EOW84917.1 hypothetical protein I569_00206 [Enterococcus dispar ATCC 51266]OJG35835.1 hypothetical protein RV01_GL001859 [Enterococcus dispar]